MIRCRTCRRLVTAVVCLTLVTSACGGGDDDAGATTVADVTTTSTIAPSTTTPAPATTAEPVTSTAAPADTSPATTEPVSSSIEAPATTSPPDTRPIDNVSQELALAFTLQETDYSPPWSAYEQAAATDGDFDRCSAQDGGPMSSLTNGAAQRGPIMQLGEEQGFVSSIALAFPDEATALDYVALVNTDDFAQCTLDALQAFMDENSPGLEMKFDATTDDTVGTSGLERYILMSGSDANGLAYLNELALYRLGRVVVRVTREYGPMTDETSAQLDDDSYAALSNAYDRVYALI